MNAVEVPFGAWLPDQADYRNPGLTIAANTYPGAGGYSPFRSPVGSGDVTTETVRGARQFNKSDAVPVIVAGSSTRLIHRISGVVTETTGLNALGPTSSWAFARFNDLVIATCKENDPQYLADLETDTSFVSLPGSPPKGAVIGRVNDWLVIGDIFDTQDGGANKPNRVRWSAFNNPTTSWATDRGELASFRDLDPKYGRITGIVEGQRGIVFQERAIWRMTFVGAPKVFEFEPIAEDRGCVSPHAAVTVGYRTYFWDRGGLFVTNGSEVQPVGDEILNETLEKEVNQGLWALIHGSVNWPERSILWTYTPQTGGGLRRHLIYSFVTQQWASAEVAVDWTVQTDQASQTLGSLSATYPTLDDAGSLPVGNPDWIGTDRALGAFIASGSGSEMADFSGETLEALFQTGDFALKPGKRTHVSGISPIIEIEGGDVYCSTVSRSRQGKALSETQEYMPGVDGFAPQQVDNWFHRFKVRIPAGSAWEKASGVWVRGKVSGAR